MELLATLLAWCKEEGFLIVFGVIGLGMVYKGGELALAHFRRVDHSAAAAEEHIAAIAQQLLDNKLDSPEVAKRRYELSNGGPRATSDEILLHLLDHGNRLGEIKTEIVEIKQRLEKGDTIFAGLPCRLGRTTECDVAGD